MIHESIAEGTKGRGRLHSRWTYLLNKMPRAMGISDDAKGRTIDAVQWKAF